MLAQVLADAERAPASRQHDAAHRRVLGHLLQRLQEQLLRGDVERVHGLRAVQPHGGHPLGGGLDEDRGLGGRAGLGNGVGHGAHHPYIGAVPHQRPGHEIRHSTGPAATPSEPPLLRRIRESVIGDDQVMHGPVRPAPGHLRRLHRVRPGADLHRGLHPRRGAAPLRQHPHRVQRHRPADHPAARGRPRDHPRRGRRRRRDRRDLLRLRLHRRDRQADRHPRPAHPGRPRRPLPPQRRDPGRPSARSCSSARSSTTPTSCRWRESIADVVVDPRGRATATSTSTGSRAELERYADRPLQDRLVLARPATSPASSPTPHGIADAAARARRAVVLGLRRRGAVRRHRDVRRPASRTRLAYKDAIFLSPHKFIGGPGTPGRARRAPRAAAPTGCPDVPGGGTVAYVNPTEHRYLDDPAHREEGGTPAIVESIRAGLVFQLKQAVGVDVDPRARGALPAPRGRGVAARAGDRDPRQPRRRAAVDRVVRRARASAGGRYLHHNFVVAAAQRPVRHPVPRRLLVRRARTATGCSASTSSARHEFEREIAHGCEGIKPGWVRVNFNYFISEAVFDYVVEAVRLVARARLAAAAATTASTRRPGCGTTATARSSRRCGWPRWATTTTAR